MALFAIILTYGTFLISFFLRILADSWAERWVCVGMCVKVVDPLFPVHDIVDSL